MGHIEFTPHNYSAERPFRLAVVTAFPIQYNAPFFRALSKRPEIELTVLYASLLGAEKALDDELGIEIEWDVPLLDGYEYQVIETIGEATVADDWRFFSAALAKVLKSDTFDAVLIYGWGSWFDRVAIGTCVAKRIPYLLTGDSAPIFPEPPLKGAVKHILVGWVVRHASALLYTGTLQRIFYERFGVPNERLFLHPWGTDNERFFRASEKAAANRSEIRSEWGVEPNIPVAVFAGKLIERKRPADLLRAIATLQGDRIDCGAVLIGEGSLREELEETVRSLGIDNVVFAGFVNQAQLPELLTACDFLVLPSEIEPRGVVINEAMACGLPVVISHRAADWGPGDIVEDGITGYVYFAGDVEALTDKCLRPLIQDADLRAKMGAAARTRIETWGIDERVEGAMKAVDYIAEQAGRKTG